MYTFVCIKQVPDTEAKIKLNGDKSGIDAAGIKWVMNPYDEYAVEEALKFKADGHTDKIIVISLGPKARVVDSIRTALAMGADEGVVIDVPESLDSYTTAKALSEAIKAEGEFNQIFTGKLSIDFNNSSVSQMLAGFLNIPHATVVTQFKKEDGSVEVEREIEGGAKEVIQLKGANLVAANKGLNTPRYASLPGIMKAKKKPMKETDLAAFGLSADQAKYTFSNFELPPEKPPVKMLGGDSGAQATELAKLLREEAKVL